MLTFTPITLEHHALLRKYYACLLYTSRCV